MNNPTFSGQCYCGAVRFEVYGDSDWIGHCHCQSCRRASGSVMTTFAGFRNEQIVFTGAMPNRFTTEDGVTRSFCGQCGSPVSYENADEPGEVHLQAGLFDNLDSLEPQDHSFRNEKPGWLKVDDELPDSGWSMPSENG